MDNLAVIEQEEMVEVTAELLPIDRKNKKFFWICLPAWNRNRNIKLKLDILPAAARQKVAKGAKFLRVKINTAETDHKKLRYEEWQ